MNLKTVTLLLKGAKLPLLLRLKGLFTHFYRVSFLAAMADTPMMEKLSRGPVSLEVLTEDLPQTSTTLSTTEAWLNLGVSLGVFKKNHGGFSLKGFLVNKLAKPENAAIRALLKEVAGLHYQYIMQTPSKLENGKTWLPSDEYKKYGDLVARSSQTLEPFLFEIIDRVFPASDNIRLLEVGCWIAGYMIYAASRYPELQAVGLELDPQVAEAARKNITARNLQDRITILVKDIRNFKTTNLFDVLTLYNNIYYFPVKDRINLLKHAKTFLKPGGLILLTTGCSHGGIEFELVNLIHAATEGWGRLPDKDEMLYQMEMAGFENNSATNLLPGNKYYAFVGHVPK